MVNQTLATELGEDLLEGADEIGEFLHMPPRQVYYNAEQGRLPIFRLPGSKVLRARKTTLRRHVERLEREAMAE